MHWLEFYLVFFCHKFVVINSSHHYSPLEENILIFFILFCNAKANLFTILNLFCNTADTIKHWLEYYIMCSFHHVLGSLLFETLHTMQCAQLKRGKNWWDFWTEKKNRIFFVIYPHIAMLSTIRPRWIQLLWFNAHTIHTVSCRWIKRAVKRNRIRYIHCIYYLFRHTKWFT